MGHSAIKQIHKNLSEDLTLNISSGSKNFFQYLIPSLLMPSLFNVLEALFIAGSTKETVMTKPLTGTSGKRKIQIARQNSANSPQ